VQEEDTKEAVQVSPLKIPVEANTSPSRSSVLQEVIEAVKLVEGSRESVRLQKVLDTDMKTQGALVTSTLKIFISCLLSLVISEGAICKMGNNIFSCPKVVVVL
jgi:hypothetical protein